MKKLLLLFSFLMISAFILPDIAYAHASTKRRSRCSWWKKRHKVSVRVTELGIIPLCLKSGGSCGTISASCIKPCASATATRGPNINYTYSESNPSVGILCGAGSGQTMLSRLILDHDRSIFKEDVPVVSKLSYSDDLDETARTYRLYGMNGQLSIPKGYPGIVEINITLWQAQDDEINFIEDTLMTDEKTFNNQFIRVRDNKVEFSEMFKGNPAVKISETETAIVINFKDMEFSFDIPDFVDIEKEFASDVTTISDPDNERIAREAASSKITKFNVYPNPSNGQFSLSKVVYAVPSIQDIQIFNAQGIKVRTLNGQIAKDINQGISRNISIPNLPSGTYYLTIRGEGFFEVKRIVIHTTN